MSGLRGNSAGPEETFVSFLRGLELRNDRGALAKLRRNLGKRAPDAEMLRLVVPHLPQADRDRWKAPWYFRVASLFALHPEPGGRGNMGDVFRRLGSHESAQKRFVALLESNPEDLPHRLRQAVSLAKSAGVPINWLRLVKDLLHWDNESRYVQEQWARAYWGYRREESAEPQQTQTVSSADAQKKGG